MFWTLLPFIWAVVCCAAVFGAVVSHSILKEHFRRLLEAAEAKWKLQHEQDSPGSVIEHVSLGWLNLLLQSLWSPLVSQHAARLTTELLHKALGEVLIKGRDKAPWRYVESIQVEEMNFGLVPPSFQMAQAKFDPTASMLTISTDVRFTSSSAQAVLLVRSKAVGMFAPVTVRLEVTHVKLRGRLRLGLVLGQDPPGIQGLWYSFSSPPHLDVAVRPLGLPLPSVVPAVDTALKGVLSKLISRRLVEPQRRYLDIQRIYLNKHIARVGGPGGLLQVVVQRAKHLGDQQQQQQTSGRSLTAPSTDAKGATRTPTSFTSNAAKLSSYCEVKFDNVLLRTPIVHHLSIVEARWDRQLSLALPFELCDLAKSGTGGGHSVSEGGAACTPTASSSTHTGLGRGSAGGSSSKRDEFVIAVLDAQTVGQPVLLGTAKVSLCTLQLQPNGPPRALQLPLHHSGSGTATVQLTLQWLKSTKPQDNAQVVQRAQQQQQPGHQANGHQVQIPQVKLESDVDTRAAEVEQPAGSAGATDTQRGPQLPVAPASPNKSVSWHDKLRAPSAAGTAKKPLKDSISSQSMSGMLRSIPRSVHQHTHDMLKPAKLHVPVPNSAGDVGSLDVDELSSGDSQQAAAPWAASRASSSRHQQATAIALESSQQQQQKQQQRQKQQQQQQQQQQRQQQPCTIPGSSVVKGSSLSRAVPPPSYRSATSVEGRAAASATEGVLDQPVMRSGSSSTWSLLTGSINWLPGYTFKGWGVGARSESSTHSAAGAALQAAKTTDLSTSRHGPWPYGDCDDSDDHSSAGRGAWGPEGWQDSQGHLHSAAVSSGGTSPGATPLALLSHVVHMQKELDEQRLQMEALQARLQHTTNSYQQLKQACWQRGRAALQQGARFLLHRADGSTHHVLLYLTQAGSSRGGGQQTSRLANNQRQEQQPQQQPRSSGGLVLVLAALPETRKQARAAYRRLAATAADGQSSERPSSDSTSSPSAPPAGSSAGAALGNTGAPSPRMSALGAVSAGLRLRMQRGTLLQLGYESGKFPRQTLSTLKTIPVTQLVGIVRGSTNAAAARVVSSAGGAFDGSTRGVGQSFDLLVQEELRGDVTAIRLQVPAVGNGRSVSEWVAALRDVAVASSPAAPAGARQFHGRPATEAGTPAAGRVRGELHSDADLQEDEVQAERDAEGATGSRTASGQQPQWVEPEMVAPQCNGSRGSLDQQVLEAHDWMLPSAAGRTPKPWAGRVTEGSAGAGLDSSSCSSASNSSDADDA